MDNFALIGSHQNIRNLFFKLRELVAKSYIPASSFTPEMIEFFKDLRYKQTWTNAEAQKMNTYLQQYSVYFRRANIDMNGNVVMRQDTLEKKVVGGGSTIQRAVKVESISLTDKGYSVYFNYTKEKYECIKKISGSKYFPESRSWLIPFDEAVSLKDFSRKFAIPFGVSAQRMVDSIANNLELSYSAERLQLPFSLRDPYDFFDYQTVGVEFAYRMKRSLIADVPGLGKTIQAIGASVYENKWPILIACPKSLRINWKIEIEKYTDKRAVLLNDKSFSKIDALIDLGIEFFIINYDSVGKFFCSSVETYTNEQGKKKIKATKNKVAERFHGLIVDEFHECKNRKSVRFKVFKEVSSHMDFRIGLTGTPFVNSIADISSQLELLGILDKFGGYSVFDKKYGKIKRQDFENGTRDPRIVEALKDLNVKLRTMAMIRREKHQVLKDLPDKFRRVVYCELENQSEYDQAEIDFMSYLEQNPTKSMSADALAKMRVLQKLSAKGKIETIAREVKSLTESDKKVVLFCWHLDTIEAFRKHFPNLVEISGNVNDVQIEENKKRFQDLNNKECNLIVITYKKGGVGHTLTASSDVFFAELGWNPKDQDQAEDRCHRISQVNSVTCHYFLGKDSIDEHVYNIIDTKRVIGSISLDDKKEYETSVEMQVLRKYLK